MEDLSSFNQLFSFHWLANIPLIQHIPKQANFFQTLWKLSKYEVDKPSSVSSKGLARNFQAGLLVTQNTHPKMSFILPPSEHISNTNLLLKPTLSILGNSVCTTCISLALNSLTL